MRRYCYYYYFYYYPAVVRVAPYVFFPVRQRRRRKRSNKSHVKRADRRKICPTTTSRLRRVCRRSLLYTPAMSAVHALSVFRFYCWFLSTNLKTGDPSREVERTVVETPL